MVVPPSRLWRCGGQPPPDHGRAEVGGTGRRQMEPNCALAQTARRRQSRFTVNDDSLLGVYAPGSDQWNHSVAGRVP